jgi:hypothetical protein
MRQLPYAQKKAEEEDDDHRPKWETAPPTTKREWKASITLMKRKTATLTECDTSAPFRVSEFPSCLLHAEADLKPIKAFKEASLRTNVGGACGLAFVRCGEMAFSALGRDSDIMSRLNATISGDSTQDVEMLLQVLKDTREDLSDIRKGLRGIANVDSSIAAGFFNQGIEEVRHLIWESSAAKSIRPTLELCLLPSPTCSATTPGSRRPWKQRGAGCIRPPPTAPGLTPTPAPVHRSQRFSPRRGWLLPRS